ncbi:MAG: GGDEF domain-containing protein [Pseudomonadales bacterium]|nr:GGDEF domain-containing protein [Pseudomonadales bacterium]
MLRFSDTNRLSPPRSAYEAELERGLVALRFPAALEREFRKLHLMRVASRVRAWQAILLVVVVVSSIYRLGMLGGFGLNFETLLRCGVLLPACVAMSAAAWSQKYTTVYMRTALFGSMVMSVAASALVAQLVGEGSGSAIAFLTTIAFATFFLAGLLFFDALLVAVLGVVAFIAAGSFYGMAPIDLIYCSALLALVAGMGTYIAHGVEQSNRRFFLERGRLGDLAERDGLTGLRNRRAFDDHLVRVWQQSLRDRSAIAVLMIDLDHFKSYNDSYGHQAGDACLRHVAQLVQGFARRPLDVAARYGGEELAIVLYQVTTEHAMAVAEQLRASVEASRIEHREAPVRGQVTVSVGVAWMEASLERSPDEAVQLADQALYGAKLRGRNLVRVVGSDEAPVFVGGLRRLPAG